MDNDKQQADENPIQSQSGPDQTRRRLTGSALGASAILTLASSPVLGWTGGGQCLTPSGFASGNLSSHGTPPTCTGRTPGYWGTHPEAWLSPYSPGTCAQSVNGTCKVWKSDGTLFHPLFNGTTFIKNGKSLTLMQVIWLQGNGDPYQLGAHIVAALLNARAGYTPVLTEGAVINIWNEYVAKGYFEPVAGVHWDGPTIVSYLQSTMTV